MKLLAVFNSLPDILFVWCDRGYLKHLKKTLSKDEFMKTLDLDVEDVRLDVIGQFFSPLIASQKYMLDAGDPYSAITCEDGSIIVLRQFEGLFYVSLCGDGEESEWYVQRRISFFHYLVNAFYGPSTDQLKPPSTLQRQQRWQRLSSLVETWHTLSQQEQIFLVEALERLNVNSHLNSTCLQLLGEALSKASRNSHAVHSLLLVNNKLLGLYSQQNAPELNTSDILLLTVFAKDAFKYVDKFVPFSLNNAPSQLNNFEIGPTKCCTVFNKEESSIPKVIENFETPKNIPKKPDESPSSVMDYMSANSTPLVEPISTFDNFHTPKGGSPISDSEIEAFKKQILDESLANANVDADSYDTDLADTNDASPSISEHSAQAMEDCEHKNEEMYDVPNDSTDKHHQVSLFLKGSECPYLPHVIDLIKLDSATVLIIISENRTSKYAFMVHQILKLLKMIIFDKGKLLKFTETSIMAKFYERLDSNIKKFTDSLSNQGDLQYETLIKNLSVLKERWENAKQNGIKAFLESETTQELPPKIYIALTEVIKGLKAIFNFIYIVPKPVKQARFERQMKILSTIRELAMHKLSDYSSYLQVRGQRNVTMTAYHNDFPGLVHYIYINRTSNQLISPTINQQAMLKSTLNHKIKQRIWQMWQYAENHVTQGYSSFVVKDGEFVFSYFIWFEDAMGKPIPVQEVPRPNFNCNLSGVMSTDFYTELVKYCFPNLSPDSVHCYELFCVHVGMANNRFVATSCKRLASQLWETSGEASSPIGLL